jgi:hypothetical protein
MTPEEENKILKQRLEDMSLSMVALTAQQYEQLQRKTAEDGATMILSVVSDRFNINLDSLLDTYKFAKEIVLDRQLSEMTKIDPSLAALLDDREVEDVPTFPEYP